MLSLSKMRFKYVPSIPHHTTKIRIYPLQMLYIFIIFELLFYLHISKYSVGVTTGIFEVT